MTDSMPNALDVLADRGFIYDCTDRDGLRAAFDKGPVTFYVGFDPTATSLHAGNLVGIMAMAHLQRLGHRPIAISGGGTGRIGDPTGRDVERQLLTEELLTQNLNGIREQLSKFLDLSEPSKGLLVDNYDWLKEFGFLEALRVIGVNFSVNQMLSKESVRKRLDTREQGLTYTEFSYQLLQAWDFWHLYNTEGCRLQGGGSDQWGNITAGTDLIRRMNGGRDNAEPAFGLVWPLLTTSAGVKFGKSAGNALWLNPDMTSPYEYYQYWINTSDEDVPKFLKFFTFLSLEEIDEIAAKHAAEPHKRYGQQVLAREATTIVHGAQAVEDAISASEILFGKEPFTVLQPAVVLAAFADAPVAELASTVVLGGEQSLAQVLNTADPAISMSEVRRLVKQQALRVNNMLITDAEKPLDSSHVIADSLIVVRMGKKRHLLIRLI